MNIPTTGLERDILKSSHLTSASLSSMPRTEHLKKSQAKILPIFAVKVWNVWCLLSGANIVMVTLSQKFLYTYAAYIMREMTTDRYVIEGHSVIPVSTCGVGTMMRRNGRYHLKIILYIYSLNFEGKEYICLKSNDGPSLKIIFYLSLLRLSQFKIFVVGN